MVANVSSPWVLHGTCWHSDLIFDTSWENLSAQVNDFGMKSLILIVKQSLKHLSIQEKKGLISDDI
jgi:hypothetical protein